MTTKGYQYLECGLPNVWLANGYEMSDTPYGRGVSIRDVHGLHRCIARVLCKKPTGLTGAEFRFLRRELDFSQEMMGALLGRTKRQIGNIERGEDLVKEPFNRLIRHIYLARIDPSNSYLELFNRLRSIDVEWHDQLTMSNNEHWLSNVREATYA